MVCVRISCSNTFIIGAGTFHVNAMDGRVQGIEEWTNQSELTTI